MSETLQPALPDELDDRAERLMKRVCAAELKVATAESCTGGLLASLLTDVEGAGHGFDRGFVTYEETAKQQMLGLPADLTGRNDAVTSAVARAMAEGALQNSQSDIALSVTGFAGPAAPGKEEGLVHFGCARHGRATLLREEHFGPLGRGPIRIKALGVLLEMLEQALDEA
ncbi:CinA family protein [Sphingomonas sp. BN140010]|uniref:CinA family protein n=1 Tax=Sphingomonas arvum TaxID=2992113 RepID=A0ABT3JCY5_9SPHN|nr:CinA family protein [Sphingomonas sp. BN140010]MCW3796941.1 CinA family protein [Sphingomonas sp. BN140010]